YTRDTPMTKTTNYLEPIRILNQTRAAGAKDVLYHDGTHVSESSRSNIFIVDAAGNIATPRTDALEGITRMKTIELAQQHFTLSIRDVSIEELLNATECFISSSTKGVWPVVQVDEHRINDGQPGPVTMALVKYLEDLKLDYIRQRKKVKSS
ncbi:MAG: aminotransferase class IV, partial [Bacteroidota bacterium]